MDTLFVNFYFLGEGGGGMEDKEGEKEEVAQVAQEGRGRKREEGRRNKSYHRCVTSWTNLFHMQNGEV